MKTIGIILLAASLIFSPNLLRSQTAMQTSLVGSFNNDLAPVQTAVPDSIVQVTAEAQGLPLLTPDQVPFYGTFWWVLPGGAYVPAPCPPQDLNAPIYQMADGQFLVDQTYGQVAVAANTRTSRLQSASTVAAVSSALETQATSLVALITQVQTRAADQQMRASMQAMGLDFPSPDGDSGTNSFSPNGSSFTIPDYGTNLWIAQWNKASGNVTGIASNTIAYVSYEILTNVDLTTTNWGSTGLFIYGSDTTNWTPLPLMSVSLTHNCFFRLKSWASSDGSGLPDWWELQYFGTTGVDPYGNPAGDGYSNIQKFQNGMNPNIFYTPAAPQGVLVNYNANNGTANISWTPSAGQVTGYTVTDSDGYTFNVSANTSTTTLNVSSKQPDPWNYGTIPTTYTVRANYSAGNSAVSAAVPLEAPSFAGSITPGSQGAPILTVQAMPANTTGIRLTEMDENALNSGTGTIFVTNFTVPISSFTNGSTTIPNVGTPSGDAYYWVGQAVGSDGSLSAAVFVNWDYNNYISGSGNNSMTTPFYDGRVQMKQNLIFKLRAAQLDMPFTFYYHSYDQYAYWDDAYNDYATAPSNYVYSGFHHVANPDDYAFFHDGTLFDALFPFKENYLDRNFVFNLSNIDPNSGAINTGVNNNGDYWSPQLYLATNASFQFQAPTTSWTTLTGLIPTNTTRWLSLIAPGGDYDVYAESGLFVTNYTQYIPTFALGGSVYNLFGLQFLSAELTYENNSSLGQNTLNKNNSITFNQGTPVYAYAETAQPQFQTVEYDFWNANPYWDSTLQIWTANSLPGNPNFALTNGSQPFLTAVGSSVQIAGYAKMSVANSIHTVYGYLGQYFDKAYKVDTNGNMTANTTGVLSPYGDFFPTEPGQAALVTMPDIDSGARGTCAVYSVSVQLDSNHDGNMDLSFNGADFTSANNPVQIWVNDNYDRGHIVDGNDFEQDDLGPVDVATGYLVPDYQYMTNGLHAIPCTRDLEDYFRLWTPGLSAAMSAMPAGYTAQFTLSGDGQIRIFRAVEANGGTNYLFDETTASNQVANSGSLHVGLLTASTPVTLNNTNEHYIFCGVKRGSAQIDLQILDASQNVIADFPAYLQIKSIKEMYERWTVGDMPNNAPTSVAVKDASDLPMNPPVPAFAYSASQNTNTPYILFVHGWNMERWEKDRYAETAFKRLYWQGYHGRFGSFRWPTHYDFSLTGINNPINDPKNFDNSESNAWASAVGLLNKLNDLNNQYPGQVYLMAHSMGNVVAGEALRLAGNNHVVNTYVAMQGAIASHAYDSTTTTRSLGIQDSATPNRYAQYWTNGAPCYFNNSVGAGIYVNFYNTNDYALNSQNWQLDQNLKPDIGYTYDAYNGGFFRGTIVLDPLNFPANTYELFAYCIEARCYAIGAQANVGGSFTTARQVNLSGSPYNFANTHKYHSGEFRSDNMSRTLFWNAVLTQMRLN